MSKGFIDYLNEIAKKWRSEWEKAKLHEADVSDKPKFFITAAFPYPNSPMHLGHSRTYSITDAYARYMRMKGYNVLFPMGFHYTGTPVIAMSEKVKIANEVLSKVEGKVDLSEFLRTIWNKARTYLERGECSFNSCFHRALNEELKRLGLGEVGSNEADAVLQTALFVIVFDLPLNDVKKLVDPLTMADYFSSITEESMKEMGYMIDWRRKFRTIDDDFKSFIVWQFYKLKELGYIEKGTHPVAWDPIYNTPVSQHDTLGDVEPEIEDYDVILFKLKDSDLYLPAATLRAETVFGVTNMWVHPEVEYKIVEVEGKKWVLSPKAAYKIGFQKKGVREIGSVKGTDLLKKFAINPATGDEVPVLPATFVDPNIATGVVMSVPAHAPFDYIALKDLEGNEEYADIVKNISLIRVIEVPGEDELPVLRVIRELNISSQLEKDKLTEATSRVYLIEFRKGKMDPSVFERIKDEKLAAALRVLLAGKSVPEARELTAEWLKAMGYGDVFYEIKNGPVYSRFGNEVVVKVLEDQWFINYGDEQWKRLARTALSQMKIIPEKFRRDFEETIEWLQRRACARTRGLGTPLPWDEKWVIESLSDSTIYMAFYTVVHILRESGVSADKLKPEVWEYILLGKGEVKELSEKYGLDPNVLVKARESFSYWYPLDSRHSGKDLIKNHLTFFIFNHAAIFPEDLWPRQIVVNGFVTLEGKKMSKSLGNIIPLYKATKKYSPDVVRLALLYSAELEGDADFSEEVVGRVLSNLSSIKEIAELVATFGEVPKPEELKSLDAWMMSYFVHKLDEITRWMDELRLRSAANAIYFEILNEIKRYVNEVKSTIGDLTDASKWVLKYIVERWIRTMVPFTPYFAEELWHLLGNSTFVLNEGWPRVERDYMDKSIIAKKEFVDMLADDITEIIKVAKITNVSKIKLQFADEESYNMLRLALKILKEGKGMREFMAEGTKIFGKSKAKDLRKIFEIAQSLPESLRSAILEGKFDEKKSVEEFKGYLERRVGAPIEITEEGGKKKPLPTKPAVYVE
ncbi:leucine--tRNA ligase [Ignicoccus islandicus]|uniref:leucine--tRNA ligase n=1 Tax=Ignicoccus islandicus TaxID=54259 RepID=UPI0009467BFD|nr:leucine--tRNA ligase [Ignicoccus islandicus]